ncbi:hypothetical protein ACHAWF_001189, partial [Thalassiosira exigua]
GPGRRRRPPATALVLPPRTSPPPPPPLPPPPARPVKSFVVLSVLVVSIGVAPPRPTRRVDPGRCGERPTSTACTGFRFLLRNGRRPASPPLHPPPQINPDVKPHIRLSAGKKWTDPTLAEFPANDFHFFVGILTRDLRPHHLKKQFVRYPSFAMGKIVTNKANGKLKGYGFIYLCHCFGKEING